ncbi:MAG: hypothetical protein M0Z84_11875 [Gammaproteobacteria bacterium]|nr:hypothetical protein [Gammaproteobacteria bacterium]
MRSDLPPRYRLPLLVLGFIALGLGVEAGLARLGWNVPLPYPGLTALHGPLMVSGFFGTLISLERAVALSKRWAYGAPLFTALGAMALILGAAETPSTILITLGSLVMLSASLSVYRRQRALFTATLALGAAAWLVGNALWVAGLGMAKIVPWWAAYLILTIAGERLELSRFLPPSGAARRLFTVIIALFIASLLLADIAPTTGHILLAPVLLALALWLARYDIARRTMREHGLTRFIALSLLSGYAWLAIAALVGLFDGGMFSRATYDATLHAVFLGFVFAMVFGHAPIILPSVTRISLPYRPAFYLHLALLHLSLICRLAGDLLGRPEWRSIGGLLNAVTLALFVLNTLAAVATGLLTKAGTR